jgi:predicted Zn-dependent peptidase
MIPLLLFFLQEIPDHPDKLKYPAAKFVVPDPGTMREQLRAGPGLYALEDPELPLIHLQVNLRAGSFWDPPGKEGLAAMCGAVMRTGGTKSRAPKDLDEELEFLAAELGISLGEFTGSASLSVLAKDFDKGLEILVEVLRDPDFRQEKIDLYKQQAFQRLKERNDRTEEIEAREANLLLYGPDHPVNRLPTRKSIESITRDDLRDYHRMVFRPGNFLIAASGAFKKSELLAALENAFQGFDVSVPAPKRYAEPAYEPLPGVYCFNKDAKNITQGRITMAHPGIRIDNPDLHAIRVMNYIYGGGGFSSRLMQRVRTEEGLAYDVRSEYQPGIGYLGTFRIRFQSKNDSCPYAMALCLEEMKKIQMEKPTVAVVDAAKKFFIDGFPAFFFSTKFQTVQTFASAELQNYPKDYYQTYREKIEAVTYDDIPRVARKYMKPDRLVIVAVGNIEAMMKGDGTHAPTLASFGPVKNVPLPDPETLERTK